MSSGRVGAEVPAGQEAVSLAASAERFAAGGLAGGLAAERPGRVAEGPLVTNRAPAVQPCCHERSGGVDGENG